MNEGVRAGSAVIMWSSPNSTGSAKADVKMSVWLVIGFSSVSVAKSRSSWRVVALVRAGFPVMLTLGAMSK